MKLTILALSCVILFSCTDFASSIANEVTPCMCWKRSEWIKYQSECKSAADKMSIEAWNRETEACKDYRLKEDKINGYTKKELVGIDETWTEVYVTE
jgi:hypothetical protein